MSNGSTKRLIVISSAATLFGVILFGLGGYYIYNSYVSVWWHKTQIEKQSRSILAEVGSAVRLPANDIPQIATILDVNELRDGNSFFDKAENGDTLIVFNNSGLVILFSEKTHKVLNMGISAASSTSQKLQTDDSTVILPNTSSK